MVPVQETDLMYFKETKMKKALLWGAALCALFFMMGCPADDGGGKNNNGNGNQTPEGFTLTVTGIPSEAHIIGGSLLDASMNPAAAGLNMGGSFVFVEYGTEGPDFSSVFLTPGDYFIVLANSMTGTGDNFFYTAGGQAPVLYTFPATDSLTWDDFKILGGSVEPDQLTLTVTGITGANIVGASLLDPQSQTPVAVAIINAQGTFSFFEPNLTNPAMPIPTSEPFTTTGTYVLILATMPPTPTQYIYIGEGGTYTFTTATDNNLEWTDNFIDSSTFGRQP